MKWWQTQARAKLQPARQEIRAAWGMWALAQRGRGAGKATKLKPRQWDWMDGPVLSVQIWICSILGHWAQEMSVPGQQTTGACGSLSIRSETAELQGWAGQGCCQQPPARAGAGQTQFAGSIVLQETAVLTCVPFLPEEGSQISTP